jgi:hypothetical protein
MDRPPEPPKPRYGPPDPRQIELIDGDFARVLRGKTPAERIAMGFEANRILRLRLEGHFRTTHPEWSDRQIAAETARRMLDGSD